MTPKTCSARPLLSFFLLVALGFGLFGCQQTSFVRNDSSQTSSKQAPLPAIKAEALKTLLPDTVGQGKPVVIDVYSKFCLACQQLKPKLEALPKTAPGLTVRRVDIQHLQPEEKALIQALKATTVPYVAFISGQGEIKHVFLEDVPLNQLQRAAQDVR